MPDGARGPAFPPLQGAVSCDIEPLFFLARFSITYAVVAALPKSAAGLRAAAAGRREESQPQDRDSLPEFAVTMSKCYLGVHCEAGDGGNENQTTDVDGTTCRRNAGGERQQPTSRVRGCSGA